MIARLRAWSRRIRYARLIRRSGLFDAAHYLSQCGGDPDAKRDPIAHYLRWGAARGLDPSPSFDTSAYIERHPQAGARGKNPLVDYIRSGRARLAPAEEGPDGEKLLRRRPFRPPVPNARRILVLDHRLLTPDQDSGSVRMLAILKLLRELGLPITFVSDSERREARYEDLLRDLGIAVHYGFSAATEHLAAEGETYRYALLSRPEQAFAYLPAVRAYAPHAKVIYDTVDLHWVRMQREADVTGNAAAREQARHFRRMELSLAACSDVVVTVTEAERDTLLAEVPGARVEVVPNVHACEAPPEPWSARKDLMFIGGFEHSPNVDAVRWFAAEILPLVAKELPGVLLHVVGSKAPVEVRQLESPSVHVAGWVPDARRYFDGSRVFVSPLRYGAGLKGKIGESMSRGLPVVTTSIGAEGMGLADGEEALVADSPSPFAAAVVRLYSDPLLWAKLSAGGLRHVRARYAPEVVARNVQAMLGEPAKGEAEGGTAAPASAWGAA